MINKCPVCGNDTFNTLQTRRGKRVYFSNGHPLGSENKRGRTLEIHCSECKTRLNNDFSEYTTTFGVKDGKWTEIEEGGEIIGYDFITNSKDEMTRYLLSRTKEATND